MAEERVQRRLAAVMVADMVGYSRLMGADEEGTIARLKAHRAELIDPEIDAHGGRIVKTMGDGLLVEFPSVVDAVKCAVAVQEGMAGREQDLSEKRRIQFRIGVNLGDIVIDGEDILGDGVNIAARLEGLAEPGGICVSAKVFEEVGNKLDLGFEDLGPQEIKNIATPVRAYRLGLEGAGSSHAAAPGGTASEVLERPAVAVLPFDNMSGEAEQEYFADGLTEDIITELSKCGWFPVIARNSTFVFKGTSNDIKEVGEKLGARYVVEGSVRKAGNRVRINAQLIDTATGHHIWAERYDRELVDVFSVQDEITMNLAGAIMPELSAAQQKLAMRKPPENMEAWDIFLQGQWLHSRFTREDFAEARQLLLEAVRLDPEMSMAHALISDIALWS